MGLIHAELGPTNTGKTHAAVERMLEHPTGMIGLPLRLLAREVYDRVTAKIGESSVALVTGEERRIPADPRYWICTVEAMPVSLRVDFLAVDEIQLIGHRQRGHVFTQRLLEARGEKETWFLGSDTARELVAELVPQCRFRRRPRLSQLRDAGRSSLGGLPRRSAVVAFSMARVYELAEALRARRGGAAVVLGALSPRARNAQVAMYQAGEVDYMVATDAIGMGLNLDLGRVAFASLRKFDGNDARELDVAELAQIAGRAGRYQEDGTFGTLQPLPALPKAVARAIERHRFPAMKMAMWRSSELEFESIEALSASLRRPPFHPLLRRKQGAEDQEVLERLVATEEVTRRAADRQGVELLWAVCQIPDFRRLLVDHHAALLAEIFVQLRDRGRLESDWLRTRVDRLDECEGDIETLLQRMAFVRTWTYVSHRETWLDDAAHWQAKTRDIEDRLSDALHDALVRRFVSPSPRTIGHASQQDAPPPEGPFAVLAELRQQMDGSSAAAQNPKSWVDELVEASHTELELQPDGAVHFRGELVARLRASRELPRPVVSLALSQSRTLGAGAKARVARRLTAWVRDLVNSTVAPLRTLVLDSLSTPARGLVYQLERGLGTVRVADAQAQIHSLTADDRTELERVGVHLGRKAVYLRSSLASDVLETRRLVCSVHAGIPLATPRHGSVSFRLPRKDEIALECVVAMGFLPVGPRAVRADALEQLHATLSELARLGPDGRFEAPKSVSDALGSGRRDLVPTMRAMGYRRGPDGHFERAKRTRKRRPRRS